MSSSSQHRVTRIAAAELFDRAPYSYAALDRATRLVFAAGACPLDAAGVTVAPDGVATRAEQVMQNLRVALAAAGAELTGVVKTMVYVATGRQQDLLTAWEVVTRHFGEPTPPSTSLGVAVLGYRDQLVEVDAVATLR